MGVIVPSVSRWPISIRIVVIQSIGISLTDGFRFGLSLLSSIVGIWMGVVVASVPCRKVAICTVVVISISITYCFGVRFSLFTSIQSIRMCVIVACVAYW